MEFLKKKGVKQASIKVLEEEEITDYTTLKALTEEDINGLNLKVGQKALIRNLTVGGKSRVKGMSTYRRDILYIMWNSYPF